MGPMVQPGGVQGPAPIDFGALAALQQQDALGRYQAGQQQSQGWLDAMGTVGGAFAGNPGLFTD